MRTAPKQTDEFIVYSKLKSDHGWTDSMIEKLLGAPDLLKPNPHYKKAAPMRLFLLDRVAAIEVSEAFRQEKAKAERRQASSSEAVETRIANMVSAMETARLIIVEGKTAKEIEDLAFQTRGGNYAGEIKDDFQWTPRAARNCIRHNLTNYEALWPLTNRGETGQPAYDLLRERIDDLIDENYDIASWFVGTPFQGQDGTEPKPPRPPAQNRSAYHPPSSN